MTDVCNTATRTTNQLASIGETHMEDIRHASSVMANLCAQGNCLGSRQADNVFCVAHADRTLPDGHPLLSWQTKAQRESGKAAATVGGRPQGPAMANTGIRVVQCSECGMSICSWPPYPVETHKRCATIAPSTEET